MRTQEIDVARARHLRAHGFSWQRIADILSLTAMRAPGFQAKSVQHAVRLVEKAQKPQPGTSPELMKALSMLAERDRLREALPALWGQYADDGRKLWNDPADLIAWRRGCAS